MTLANLVSVVLSMFVCGVGRGGVSRYEKPQNKSLIARIMGNLPHLLIINKILSQAVFSCLIRIGFFLKTYEKL